MHWKFLTPAGPRLILEGLSLSRTMADDDARLRKITRSAVLFLIPLVVVVSPMIVLASLNLELGDLKPSGFEPLDWIDAITLTWILLFGYWSMSTLSRYLLAYRHALTDVSEIMVKHGINPNATVARKK